MLGNGYECDLEELEQETATLEGDIEEVLAHLEEINDLLNDITKDVEHLRCCCIEDDECCCSDEDDDEELLEEFEEEDFEE